MTLPRNYTEACEIKVVILDIIRTEVCRRARKKGTDE